MKNMKKIFSLLRAAMSQDMSLFKIKSKQKSKLSKILFPIMLAFLLMFSIGSNIIMIAEGLSKVGLTFIIITLFIMLTSILTIIEGIYKSQGILFEAKDNDLLFSLPIKKSHIFFTRVFKLLTFQFIYNAVFMIPAIVVYAIYEKTNVYFYILSLVMLIILPIIPTIIGCIFGYIVKAISSRFKSRNIVQIVTTMLLLLGIFYISANMQNFIENLVQNATSINDMITKIYYPAGLYINLIQRFNIIEFVLLIATSIIPGILFIYIASIFYFKIISRLKGSRAVKPKKDSKIDENNVKVRTPLIALIRKELKRFFTSPVFIINAGFALVLLAVFTVALSINARGIIESFIAQDELGIDVELALNFVPKIYLAVLAFTSCLTCITCSMISLEGKAFNILKSLPVGASKILLAKLLTSCIISMPVIFVCDIAFFVIFKPAIIDILQIILATAIIPIFVGLLGLLANLKYPKMNAASDTEVVKQSMSSFISVFSGILISMLAIGIAIWGAKYNMNLVISLELSTFFIACIVLWRVLKTYGVKKFNEINV